jgi:hypothetical protein
MDRLGRIIAGGSLALGIMAAASGCRSMRNDVPTGKPYSTSGANNSPVGFNSDPRSNPAANAGQWTPGTNLTPGTSVPDGGTGLSSAATSGAPQYGTPTPNSGNYGAPGGYRFGSPTTTTTNP